MRVLLTGASGFVGSHVLDSLRRRDLPVVLLLRASSPRRFIASHLASVEVRAGSILQPESLDAALQGVTHVVHCAGCTRALHPAEFHEVNQNGTRHLVEAVNRQGGVQRFVLVSSLAAVGPAGPEAAARETDPPRPVSAYGRSKLGAEQEVRERCRAEFVILRPPAVYGPRDAEFLRLFRAVRAHVRPAGAGGRQPLSLVFVRDLAEVVAASLTRPEAGGKTYFVASSEIVTAGGMAGEVAAQLGTWTLPLPVPAPALWGLCAWGQAISWATRRPSVLGLAKYPELTARGWVCDARRLREELGLVCTTGLKDGVAETLAWYRKEGWL